ncbi:hypothetical protein U91I_00449 [alpha proteobacterium U9-1i]|nr:hypothetical protein U91I_00449 [alpha proteobacterium U9-1i]
MQLRPNPSHMSLIHSLSSRALDALDIAFEAIGALWRLSTRGVFTPDMKAYRRRQFYPLLSKDILVQEIALNAANAGEAKNALQLDPERFLPMDPGSASFAVAGPIDSPLIRRTQPERTFVLGIVRNETLTRIRAELPTLRRGATEGFVFAPAGRSDAPLVFEDRPGKRRRRVRRLALTLALVVFGICAHDLFSSAEARFDRLVAQAGEERVVIERRIRQAELHLEQATASQNRTRPGRTLSSIQQDLDKIALHQHPRSELTRVHFDGAALEVSGMSYELDATELSLRRAFEGQSISFVADRAGAPSSYSARLQTRTEARE